MYYLNINEQSILENFLTSKGWLHTNESIQNVTVPGAGNMNYVLRVNTGARTFILKQSRAYVEKYPQVAAPEERIITESMFYKLIAPHESLSSYMPKLLGIDPDNLMMMLEDLGDAADYTSLYNENMDLPHEHLSDLIRYLNLLHKRFFQADKNDLLENTAMKKLNHEHIFVYPFMKDNGFNLDVVTTGLQEVAMMYKNDELLKKIILDAGDQYLAKGDYLLHGDFYPGSWLITNKGIKVIDPEFCFYGDREFDLAVLRAHLFLSRQNTALIAGVLDLYYDTAQLNMVLLDRFTGIEIMRRLIGLAQLPLNIDLNTKIAMLNYATSLIKNEI